MSTCKTAGETVTGLLTDVLTLDKMEEGQFELDLQSTCLHCVTMQTVDSYRRLVTDAVRLEVSSEIVQQPLGGVLDPKTSSTWEVGDASADNSTAAAVLTSGLTREVLDPGLRAASTHDADDVKDHRCNHDSACWSMVDPLRVKQIVQNLLSNAFKFTQVGSIALHTLYELQHIRISVTDTGVGMDDATAHRLFQPYVHFADELQRGNGSGISLTICKRLALLHHGDLVCRSAVGTGSVFTLILPRVSVAQPEHLPLASVRNQRNQDSTAPFRNPLHASPAENVASQLHISTDHEHLNPVGPAAAQASRNALVVDDAEMNVKLLCRTLEARGWAAHTAFNGMQACDKVKAHPLDFFSLIFMDRSMPILDGPQAVSRIRSMGCTAVVVGLTGDESKECIAEFSAAGANHVLCKPLNVRKLAALLQSL